MAAKHQAVNRAVRRGGGGLPNQDPIERFEAKTRKGKSGCIIWDGAVNSRGYGCFGFGGKGKSVLAHKFAWEHIAGRKMPKGAVLSPKCGNKLCVEPDHWFATDPVSAVLAGDSFAGVNYRKTHCKRGHVLAGDNLLTSQRNRRVCRECKKLERQRANARAACG